MASVRYLSQPKSVRDFEADDFTFKPYSDLAAKIGSIFVPRPTLTQTPTAALPPPTIRPATDVQINAAVDQAVTHTLTYLATLPQYAVQLAKLDRNEFRADVRARLVEIVDPRTEIPLELMARNDLLCDKSVFEEGHYVVYNGSSGALRGALFDIRGDATSTNTAATKELISLIIELVLFLISLVGFVRFPNGAAQSVERALLGLMENPSFERLAKTFFDDIVKAAGHATEIADAITKFCRELHVAGFLDDLIRAALDEFSWGEWILLLGSIAASIALCFVSGGTALAIKIGLAIHDAAWIANKCEKLSKMRPA